LLAAALLFVPLLARADVAVPPLRARVTDLTSTLSSEQVAALESKLAALEARKGSQVAVLLVPTTQPESIEQYATRVFDQWKLGRKGVGDGVLFIVAKNDRRMRIEVGRGLEGAIPDAYGKRIVDEDITPRFRQGDFYGGVSAGTDRIVKLIDGEPMPPPPHHEQRQSSHDLGDIFFYGVIALGMAGVVQAALGRLLGAAAVGAGMGFMAALWVNLTAGLIVGVVLFLLSLIFGAMRGSGWSSGGGYSGGGWSSGGGGFGSGGFSGGGGDSAGGGASGSW
jgi:uncharacterized protein